MKHMDALVETSDHRHHSKQFPHPPRSLFDSYSAKDGTVEDSARLQCHQELSVVDQCRLGKFAKVQIQEG